MQKLVELCRAAVQARDWRQLVAAAVLIGAGFGMLLRTYIPGGSVERAELVEASVVARPSVTVAPDISSGGAIIGSATVQKTAAADGAGSGEIARSLQTALRRANCYDGPINGQWSRQSKEAMARFVAIVNAQLPVERPEGVLLALMEANAKQTCSSQRAAGQPAAPAPEPVVMRVAGSGDNREPSSRKSPVNDGRSASPLPPAPPPVHSDTATARPPSPEPARPAEASREALRFAPFALAAVAPAPVPVAAPVVPVPAAATPTDDEPSRGVRSSRSAKRAYLVPRRYIVRHRARGSSSGFARSVSRNVRALQRSLGMIVYY